MISNGYTIPLHLTLICRGGPHDREAVRVEGWKFPLHLHFTQQHQRAIYQRRINAPLGIPVDDFLEFVKMEPIPI